MLRDGWSPGGGGGGTYFDGGLMDKFVEFLGYKILISVFIGLSVEAVDQT